MNLETGEVETDSLISGDSKDYGVLTCSMINTLL